MGSPSTPNKTFLITPLRPIHLAQILLGTLISSCGSVWQPPRDPLAATGQIKLIKHYEQQGSSHSNLL